MRTEARTLRTIADFDSAGLLKTSAELERVADKYALALSAAMADIIETSDDPIARQFVPSVDELRTLPFELADPIGDDAFSPLPGLVHRYRDRVLVKITHICPVYCRFCFRREMVGPGKTDNLTRADTDAILAYIASKHEIWEVIFTGGDPLALSPRRLKSLMEALRDILHVKIIRFHSRVPVVAPHLITAPLVSALASANKPVYIALHANHPREMTLKARDACSKLIDGGISMLSQSVLLKGVNDDVEVLTDLMRAFVEARVKPYTINHADLAPGTSHFRVPIEEGQNLMRQLRGRVSGLCQPSYMLDIPGGFGKSPIGPNYLRPGYVQDYHGNWHEYQDQNSDLRA